jgi:hypothetical protein
MISWLPGAQTSQQPARRSPMGSGWHEWPLVLFTVLGQCGSDYRQRSGMDVADR